MAVALTNRTGEILNAGFATVEMESSGDTAVALQVLSYRSDPFVTLSTNTDGFASGASPVSVRVLGDLNTTLSYKAVSKASISLPMESVDTAGEEIIGAYLFDDSNSFLKIILSLPGDFESYIVRCEVAKRPTEDDHSIEVIINKSMNITRNYFNSSILYDNPTGCQRQDNLYVSLSTQNRIGPGLRRKRSIDSKATVGALAYKPRIWNETAKAWVISSEVEIDPESSGKKVIFKSNFMGTMTSGLIIPPNKIEFDDVFDKLEEETRENPYVLIVVCLLAAIYLMVLIPVLRIDRREKEMVSVEVNAKSNNEFNTDVFFALHGDKGKSAPRALNDGMRVNFQPGSLTNHTVTCQEDIGSLTHIHVWIQPRDDRDSILIDYIKIIDLQVNKQYNFLSNDWLSPTRSHCYSHEMFSADVEENRDFVSILRRNARRSIYDDHLWISVVKRSRMSCFTRVQRWSLCVATLYLTMVVNAMWFQPDDVLQTGTTANVTLKLGPVQLSWHTVYVSFMGALIVIPPTMLISLLFQKSRQFVTVAKKRKITESSNTDSSELEKADVIKLVDGGQIPEEHINGYLDTLKTLDQYDTDSRDYNPINNKTNKYLTDEELKAVERKNNTPFTVPWWGVVIGYILCGVCIVNGVWWPYIYGIDWGKEVALEWLASLVVSVLQSIIVTQPVKAILIALVKSFFLLEDTRLIQDIDSVKRVSELRDSKKIINPIEPPIQAEKIKQHDLLVTYSESVLSKRLGLQLKGIGTHLIYLALVLWIVIHNTDSKFYLQNTAVKDILQLNKIKLRRIENIWPWLRQTILPRIYPEYDYSGEPLNGYDRQFMYMTDGLRMGPVRFKQNRDQAGPCYEDQKVEAARTFKIYDCKTLEDTRNWNAKWNGTYEDGITYPPYIYENIKGSKIQGDVDSYKLGGYAVTVYEYWYDAINLMESETWIDKQTRAVFIELVIANMNVKVFSQIKIVLEMPVYGGVIGSHQLTSFKPYPFVDQRDFLFLIIYCVWGLVILYIIYHEIRDIWRLGWRSYKYEPWHIVEMANMALALTSIACFVIRCLLVVETVQFMKNNKNEYVDFDPVMRWDTAYSLTTASVLFISILQLLKPMSFSKQLSALKMTLMATGHLILWFSLAVCIILVLYSHVMTISFGPQFEAFIGFTRSFYHLFGMLIGVMKYTDHIEVDSWVLRIMFSFYMVAGNFFLLNLFISVINEFLTYIHEHPEEVEFDYELSDYMKLKFTSWWTSLIGTYSNDKRHRARVRQGGPWSTELNVYHKLLVGKINSPIDDTLAVRYHNDIENGLSQAVDLTSEVTNDKLSSREIAAIPVCQSHSRAEHTVRLAIRTIIMDMRISNSKASSFIQKLARGETHERWCSDGAELEEVCHTESGGRIGPAGGRLEVLPDTWIIIERKTFDKPTYVSVQAFTSTVFTSHIVQLNSQRPLAKPFRCCLPFIGGNHSNYCDVFVQRGDEPWTLAYTRVASTSAGLDCKCYPQGSEVRYRIAARASPQLKQPTLQKSDSSLFLGIHEKLRTINKDMKEMIDMLNEDEPQTERRETSDK